MNTKGVEDGMGATLEAAVLDWMMRYRTGEITPYSATLLINTVRHWDAKPSATPAMKDEVESDNMRQSILEGAKRGIHVEPATDEEISSYLGSLNGYGKEMYSCSVADLTQKLVARILAAPKPTAQPLKDEVESAIEEMCECVHKKSRHWKSLAGCYDCFCSGFFPVASPTLKDEVYAMLDGLGKPGQLSEATIRILWPLLEELVERRKL